MKKQCLTCKYYITQEEDCEKDYPEVCLTKYECGEYEPRFKKPECEYRYEDCQDCVSGCTNICRTAPSMRSCPFTYKCDLDRMPCDERCEKHENRKLMQKMKNELTRLIETKHLIDDYLSSHPGKSIDSIEDEIESLRKSINEIEK